MSVFSHYAARASRAAYFIIIYHLLWATTVINDPKSNDVNDGDYLKMNFQLVCMKFGINWESHYRRTFKLRMFDQIATGFGNLLSSNLKL